MIYATSRYTGKLAGFARVLSYPRRPYDIAQDIEHMCLMEWQRVKRRGIKWQNQTTESHPTKPYTARRKPVSDATPRRTRRERYW